MDTESNTEAAQANVSQGDPPAAPAVAARRQKSTNTRDVAAKSVTINGAGPYSLNDLKDEMVCHLALDGLVLKLSGRDNPGEAFEQLKAGGAPSKKQAKAREPRDEAVVLALTDAFAEHDFAAKKADGVRLRDPEKAEIVAACRKRAEAKFALMTKEQIKKARDMPATVAHLAKIEGRSTSLLDLVMGSLNDDSTEE